MFGISKLYSISCSISIIHCSDWSSLKYGAWYGFMEYVRFYSFFIEFVEYVWESEISNIVKLRWHNQMLDVTLLCCCQYTKILDCVLRWMEMSLFFIFFSFSSKFAGMYIAAVQFLWTITSTIWLACSSLAYGIYHLLQHLFPYGVKNTQRTASTGTTSNSNHLQTIHFNPYILLEIYQLYSPLCITHYVFQLLCNGTGNSTYIDR